jgi:hypothetical protein
LKEIPETQRSGVPRESDTRPWKAESIKATWVQKNAEVLREIATDDDDLGSSYVSDKLHDVLASNKFWRSLGAYCQISDYFANAIDLLQRTNSHLSDVTSFFIF